MWKAIARVLFWTYERGSLPYDIACGLILAFIFLTPPQVFDGTIFSNRPEAAPAARPGHETRHEPPEGQKETNQQESDDPALPKPTE